MCRAFQNLGENRSTGTLRLVLEKFSTTSKHQSKRCIFCGVVGLEVMLSKRFQDKWLGLNYSSLMEIFPILWGFCQKDRFGGFGNTVLMTPFTSHGDETFSSLPRIFLFGKKKKEIILCRKLNDKMSFPGESD